MTDEKKPIVSPETTVRFYVDTLTITNASTSANNVIHNLVREFSKQYAEKASEVDNLMKKST
jgi:hypothetical protein